MTLIKNKLLILDLDETLLHSTDRKLKITEDFRFERFFVYKRPFLTWFLTEISKHYKIGIWSAADECYVENMAEQILPKGFQLEIMWGKSWCVYNPGNKSNFGFYEKHLGRLINLNFNLEDILLVDDDERNAELNKESYIFIKPFRGDMSDQELKHLYAYLLNLKVVENIDSLK